jgi:hypothetical protein
MHNEGPEEDGVLSACGICGCEVYMLDPEEMDWICDPCSYDGWSGFKTAYRLSAGDVISVKTTRCVVTYVEDHGKRVIVGVTGYRTPELLFRATDKVYIHMTREEV